MLCPHPQGLCRYTTSQLVLSTSLGHSFCPINSPSSFPIQSFCIDSAWNARWTQIQFGWTLVLLSPMPGSSAIQASVGMSPPQRGLFWSPFQNGHPLPMVTFHHIKSTYFFLSEFHKIILLIYPFIYILSIFFYKMRLEAFSILSLYFLVHTKHFEQWLEHGRH